MTVKAEQWLETELLLQTANILSLCRNQRASGSHTWCRPAPVQFFIAPAGIGVRPLAPAPPTPQPECDWNGCQ